MDNHAVIKAWFGTNITVSWVTMAMIVSGVKMMAMAYAWNYEFLPRPQISHFVY
jgi:hypothetical protein